VDVALGIGSARRTAAGGLPKAAFQRAAQSPAIDPSANSVSRKADRARAQRSRSCRVARIRPFELADAWSAPRREVLAACPR
jgi:hypothetical protein